MEICLLFMLESVCPRFKHITKWVICIQGKQIDTIAKKIHTNYKYLLNKEEMLGNDCFRRMGLEMGVVRKIKSLLVHSIQFLQRLKWSLNPIFYKISSLEIIHSTPVMKQESIWHNTAIRKEYIFLIFILLTSNEKDHKLSL